MKKKLISVIIPVKNGANYIHEAIAGIKKQNMNTEIIVVDDNSDDETAKIAQSMNCLVIKNEKTRGPVIAKNTGLKEAKGQFILFHDHDDVMNENVLLQMHKELVSDESTSAVMAKVKDFISPDTSENNTAIIKTEPYYGLLTGAMLFRKEVFEKTGLFDENLTAGEILSLTAKMNENSLKTKKLDIISTNRRIHNTNYGKTNQKKEYQDYASILRSKLAKK
jgi:glycosyltransferase involved in cell wall biosynthesis